MEHLRIAKTLKTRINYMYFTVLKNVIFRRRPTYRCDSVTQLHPCVAVTFTLKRDTQYSAVQVTDGRSGCTLQEKSGYLFYLQIPPVSILTNRFHIQNPYLLPTTCSYRYAAYDFQVRLG